MEWSIEEIRPMSYVFKTGDKHYHRHIEIHSANIRRSQNHEQFLSSTLFNIALDAKGGARRSIDTVWLRSILRQLRAVDFTQVPLRISVCTNGESEWLSK
jgi:hypothetical protein